MPPIDRIARGAGSAAARGRWLARGAWLLAVAEVLVAVRDHLVTRLDEEERRRLLEIVRTSKGRPANLSDRERIELKGLIDKVEPATLARTVASTGITGRLRRR